jgi:hypothetical protein
MTYQPIVIPGSVQDTYNIEPVVVPVDTWAAAVYLHNTVSS